jgi:mRNA-degrading endonuclease RelE of RelBE toxin-antitoxin system
MRAVFVELPAFERHRAEYLDEMEYAAFQTFLMEQPDAGDVVPDSGGLRKLRFGDLRRQKGKRGGLRIIYYWWKPGSQFWLFTIYGKGEMADLTTTQRRLLKSLLKAELEARQ